MAICTSSSRTFAVSNRSTKTSTVWRIRPGTGDRVTFIAENGSVRVINSAIYAMQKFQKQMMGEAEKSGFLSEDDVAE